MSADEVCGYCFGSGTIPAPSGLNDDFDQGQPCPECSPEDNEDHAMRAMGRIDADYEEKLLLKVDAAEEMFDLLVDIWGTGAFDGASAYDVAMFGRIAAVLERAGYKP